MGKESLFETLTTFQDLTRFPLRCREHFLMRNGEDKKNNRSPEKLTLIINSAISIIAIILLSFINFISISIMFEK